MTRPNIIFIVADDLGYADLSCSGQTDFETPELDRLARDGVRFTQSYANAPLCTNTRVALMTGRYQYRFTLGLTEPLRHGSKGDPRMGLPAEHPTLPGQLREAGYRTVLIGKWHVGALPLFGPLRSGYDEFFGIMGGYTGYFEHLGDGGDPDLYEGETSVEAQGYTTHLFTDRAVDYIRTHGGSDKPFFMSLHYTAPHWPWSSPAVEEEARVRESDPRTHTDGGSPRIYADMVREMDKGIGQVMDALRGKGIDRDTLVIFTSDNGGERFSKIWPFVGRKRDLLEGGLRVPQILWWPARIAAGQVSEQVCITMDLSATCIQAAGAHWPEATPLDGVSLLPLVQGHVPPFARTLFWRMKERDQRALRSGDWKYLKVRDEEFLFDLSYDWRERTSFTSRRPELLLELRQQWERWSGTMLPLPAEGTPIHARLSDMLW